MIIYDYLCSANKMISNQKNEPTKMETLTPEQIKVAEQLRKEIMEAYPYVYPNIYAIEYFVMQSWSHPEQLTVHILYDHLLSQGLCEVEE